ncbi:hypothetical protein OCL06_16010 [Alteromonas sp. ASW11-19]|uniref:Uncharacterized protein n=1 Tax=Alteromonas salexigens TaxID=2982530 RepID=A0ABT2VT32_9ALTE|nr:hypothetical protein [Alteromonas salexigens]MCU7556097.1 hypothetical protein [Alteromonas salexigens]
MSDVLIVILLIAAPIILFMWFLGIFARKKKKDKSGWDNPNKSSLSKSIDDR